MANPEDLGRYRLKRLLGRGALGEVWEAADREQHGAKVAVKIMHAADDELALARAHFAREARLASRMRHPNVVAVHDAGEAAGTSFLVMDMVEGKSLRTLLRDKTPTTTDKLRWLRQIGEGLSAMHRAGIAHRDLKPENVIVRADRTACLVDLGMAKWIKFDLGGELDPENAIEASVERTAPASEYAPPETVSAELYDELGDQFAFGVVAYELLTGALPSDDSAPLTTREDVPAAAAAALDRARAKDRDERWDAMELLLDELGDPNIPPGGTNSEPPISKAGSGRPKKSTGPSSGAASSDDVAKRDDEPSEKRPPRARSSLVIGGVVLLFVLAATLALVLR
jgi:eukaryotic-like serine/threonine-protein kinase